MKELLQAYFTDLTESFGKGWNRFWYSPISVLPLCVLRVFVGLAAFYSIASYSTDLIRWFGRDGMMPLSLVKQLSQGYEDLSAFAPFYLLNLTENPSELWVLHGCCLAATAAFTLGLFTRVTSVLSLCAVLSYVHRAPLLTSQFEPILTMLLFYFCFAPAGKCVSMDALIWRKRSEAGASPVEKSWIANLCLRLMQVHLTMFYGVMALTKLGGVYGMAFIAPWWRGTSVWWLIAHADSRLIDLTFLHSAPLLLNAWTYLIVLFEVSFAILIWNRLARPFLLIAAIPLWGSLALISGLASFCMMMLVANLVFVSPSVFEALCGKSRPRPTTA